MGRHDDGPANRQGSSSEAAQSASRRVDPSFWASKRVLLTGHTGFKGAWLSLWLQMLGAHVVGLSDCVPTTPSLYELGRVEEEMETVTADVRDAEAVAAAVANHAPEVIIHMAAQSLVRRSFEQPVLTYETNVIGTANLLDAVRRSDSVRAFVNVTSDKCYENREWKWAYREDEPMGGHDPYSSSKGCAELVTDAFRRSFFSDPDSARIASARAGNVIGGGDWAIDRLIPDMMRAALAGEPVAIRNPSSIRPWQHVLNPLSGYLILVEAMWENAEHARAWNFGPADEDARPVRWIVERMTELWPEPLHVQSDDGEHPHEAHYLKLDSSLARARLGWRPTWDLSEGLHAVVEWYRRMREREDMRAVSVGQIEAFQYPQALA